MTSVDFDLNVTIFTDDAKKKREQYGTVSFRFTTKTTRALERAAGSGISWLVVRGQSVEALVLLLCYGLLHAYPKMTEQKATDIIDAYIDEDREGGAGDVKDLASALHKALNESGVYGKPETDDEESVKVPLGEPTTETSAPASVTG